MAALVEADVRFMSGILAPVVASNNRNEEIAGFCSAHLQVGIRCKLKCPPEGGRCKEQIRPLAQINPEF